MKRQHPGDSESSPKRVCKPTEQTIPLAQVCRELSTKLKKAADNLKEKNEQITQLQRKLKQKKQDVAKQAVAVNQLQQNLMGKELEAKQSKEQLGEQKRQCLNLQHTIQTLQAENHKLKNTSKSNSEEYQVINMQLESTKAQMDNLNYMVTKKNRELEMMQKGLKEANGFADTINQQKLRIIGLLQRIHELETHFQECGELSKFTESRAETWVKIIQRKLELHLKTTPEDTDVTACLKDIGKELVIQKNKYSSERPKCWWDTEASFTYMDDTVDCLRERPIRVKDKITIPSFADHLRTLCETASKRLTELFEKKGGSVVWQAVTEPRMPWLKGMQLTVSLPRPQSASTDIKQKQDGHQNNETNKSNSKKFQTYTLTIRRDGNDVISKWICLQTVSEALKQPDWIAVHQEPDFMRSLVLPSLATLDTYWKGACLEKDIMEIKDRMSRELQMRNALMKRTVDKTEKLKKNLFGFVKSFKERNQSLLYSLDSSKGHHSGKKLVRKESVILIDSIIKERTSRAGPREAKDFLVKFKDDWGDLWISEKNLCLAEGHHFINQWRSQQVKLEKDLIF